MSLFFSSRTPYALLVAAFAVTLMTGCQQKPSGDAPDEAATAIEVPGPILDSLNEQNMVPLLTAYGRQYPGSEVLIHTRLGNIRVKLYDDTPLHRANFLLLTRKKFFDQGGFYRIVKDFMIQGGDDDDREMGLGGYKVPAEFRSAHYHKRGALAMARFDDEINPQKASSNHDFYLVQGHRYTDADLDAIERQNLIKFTPEQRETYKTVGGAPNLDGNYTVFGEVVSGLEVVDKIASTPVDGQKWPTTEVLTKVEVVK
jgi:cyclophilin family peptidyl-prolyl cis-trans isomerase